MKASNRSGIHIQGWRISSAKGPISNAEGLSELICVKNLSKICTGLFVSWIYKGIPRWFSETIVWAYNIKILALRLSFFQLMLLLVANAHLRIHSRNGFFYSHWTRLGVCCCSAALGGEVCIFSSNCEYPIVLCNIRTLKRYRSITTGPSRQIIEGPFQDR